MTRGFWRDPQRYEETYWSRWPGVWVHGDLANWLGPIVLFAKLMFVAFLIFWVRFTYPRLREDQLQGLAWKVLIPIGLVLVLVTGLFKVLV